MAELQERLLLRQDKEQLDKEIAALDLKVEESVAEWKQARDAEGKAFYSKLQERLMEQKDQLLQQRSKLQDQLAGTTTATTVIAQFDAIAAFKHKLAAVHINRPNPDAILRISTYYASRMLVAAGATSPPEEARALYESALALPGRTSRACIQEQLHISLNGPWLDQHPYLISGMDTETNRPVVVKLLPDNEAHLSKAAAAEKYAIDVLHLDRQPVVALMPTELVTVQVTHADMKQLGIATGQRAALKMPMLCSSLSTLPQLSAQHIFSGGRRMQQALAYMHSRGLVHMDVKLANILMDFEGSWFLSDFGSSTPIGEPVWSYTQGWYPSDIRRHAAAVKHDWGMLAVTLAVLLDKDNLASLKADEDGPSIVLHHVVERCRAVRHQELSNLLQELLAAAEWL